jgi:hypothetical protein
MMLLPVAGCYLWVVFARAGAGENSFQKAEALFCY